MARIEAHAELFLHRRAVDDCPKLLKPPADLCALACHRLQQHYGRLPFEHRQIERFGNFPDAFFRSLPDVASGVKVIEISRHKFHPAQIVLHGVSGKLERFFLLCAGIERIRRVGNDFPDFPASLHQDERLRILRVNVLRRAASGVAGKKLKRVRADGQCSLAHGGKALRRGQVAANILHIFLLICKIFLNPAAAFAKRLVNFPFIR